MSNNPYHSNSTIALAFTGASGLPYGLRLLEILLQKGNIVYLMMSAAAHAVATHELDMVLPKQSHKLEAFLSAQYTASGKLKVFSEQEWTAPIASGSAQVERMVVCPCSSGCLAAIANGLSNNLIERAADVMLKEKRQLILVHRETPVSAIHLENMLKLSHAGATIMPAAPGFYHKPASVEALVDFMVARVLDHLKIEHDLLSRWGHMSLPGVSGESIT